MRACRQQYLQHIRSMYNPDYKLGLQQTLESERDKNALLKRKLAAMNTEVKDLHSTGESKLYEPISVTLAVKVWYL